jgi:phytoene dehydrogenase-like protein
MSGKYEVVIVGAGHNGLIVASYLARAGVNVCVVEDQDKVGGCVKTGEVTLPGFKHDLGSIFHHVIAPNPIIRNDELELQARYGLKYIWMEKITGVVFDDGSVLLFHHDLDRTCQSIAKFSERDAEAYRQFHEWTSQHIDMLAAGMFSPPPDPGETVAMMHQSQEGEALLRTQAISAWDLADEWFENEKIKIAMSRYGGEAMISPFIKGTGFNLFLFTPLIHKYGAGIPVGGSGELSESLARCFKAQGGTIKLSSTVKKFKISGDEVAGVVLTTGEEILTTRAVVSSLNIKQVFPKMTPGFKLPENFERNIRRLHPSAHSPFIQHLALHEAPKYKSGSEVDDCAWVGFYPSEKERYARAYQDLELGYPRPDVYVHGIPTKLDKTRAPEGKHTLFMYAYQPYHLKDGGAEQWEAIGYKFAEDMLEHTRSITTNMGDENILGRHVMTPLDIKKHNPAIVNGDICHFGMFSWQLGGNRPLPGWSQYRTPVKRFYLCGASTHPGPGVTGGGRAAVQSIMADMGIDFKKVINSR